MNLDDGARVRQPRDAFEYRLGTVTDITYAPSSTYIRRVRLLFPTGEERTYPPPRWFPVAAPTIMPLSSRASPPRAERCVTPAGSPHDYDDRLSDDIIRLQLTILGTVSTRLGVTLDPTMLDAPAATGRDEDH